MRGCVVEMCGCDCRMGHISCVEDMVGVLAVYLVMFELIWVLPFFTSSLIHPLSLTSNAFSVTPWPP